MRARLAALIFVALTTTQVALPCSAQSLTRCTSVIVGQDATADGSVLLGHNEDLGNHAAQHYIVVEAADHAPGSVEVLYGGTIVPQVDHTHGYVTSTLFDVQYIPGDATGGINDQGLMVANNLAYRRDVPWVTGIHDRVLWSEFTRLALARAATAREAVNVIGGLVETYGLGLDSGTMVGVADSQEGWWIEIAYGGQWAAERVPDDGMAIRANTFRIGEMDLDDTDNFLASPDLVAFATDKGWYTHGPFVFSEVYGDPSALNASWNTHREDRLGSQLALVMPAVTPADLMALWRDHYEGTPLDETDGYTLGTPHQTTEYCLCDMTTEVSMACQSRDWLPADIGGVCWRALATPCSSVYVPWWAGHGDIPAVYQTGISVQTDDSAYWAFRELSEAVEPRYAEVIDDLRGFWGLIEDMELTLAPGYEAAAVLLYDTDPDAARALLTDYSNAQAELVYGYAVQLLDNGIDVDALEPPGDDDDDSASDDDDSASDDDDTGDDDATPDDDDSAVGDDDWSPPGGDEGGCGCRVDGEGKAGAWAMALGLFALLRRRT